MHALNASKNLLGIPVVARLSKYARSGLHPSFVSVRERVCCCEVQELHSLMNLGSAP